MSPAIWIFLLVAVGLGMIMLEVFVPSGGVLGLLAAAALGTGIVTAFMELGAFAGVGVLAGVFVAVPIVLALAFRWFPLTPLGRRVLPPAPLPNEVVPDVEERDRLRSLVGRFGRATRELLPWGTIEIDSRRVDAVSDGGPIPDGTTVEVVGLQGRAVVVRASPTGQVGEIQPLPESPPETAGPRLSTVLEEFDFDEIRGKEGHSGPLDSPPSTNKA